MSTMFLWLFCLHGGQNVAFKVLSFFPQRFGQGLMKYSNGNSYEGGFVYDLCNNHGMMRYKDGSEYVGNWSNGLVRCRFY